MHPQIACRNVTVAYVVGDGLHYALRDVNLDVWPGEWLAVVGPNGSGKSTLTRILAGLSEVSSGTVLRSGSDTGESRIAVVCQNPEAQIIGVTPFEDVCFGLGSLAVVPEEISARAVRALTQTGLGHVLHRPVEHLSGGQKQLLAVASAIAAEPDIVIFDEATAMLDPLARSALLEAAQTLHRSGTTIVWVTHWMDELGRADRVVALRAGELYYAGPPRGFLYPETQDGPSACAALGFEEPYIVRLVRELERRGRRVPGQPLTPAEFAQAVNSA